MLLDFKPLKCKKAYDLVPDFRAVIKSPRKKNPSGVKSGGVRSFPIYQPR